MSARADILNGKFKDTAVAKEALRKAGGVGDEATLFASLVGYAHATWNYTAQSGGQTAPDLLQGDGTKNVACGTIREAFKLLLREDLKLTDVANADINGYFLTKPDLQCFDPKVKGNVGNHGSMTFELACHFSTHYFVRSGGKFYDPCLMATYTSDQGPIAHKTRLVGAENGVRKTGMGPTLLLLHLLPERSVPGFGSVWELLKPNEWKSSLSASQLQSVKNDAEIKAAKLI